MFFVRTFYLNTKFDIYVLLLVCNKINTTGDTCGVGPAYPSGAPEVIPDV